MQHRRARPDRSKPSVRSMPAVFRAARVAAVALLVMAVDVPLAMHAGAQQVPPLSGS